MRLCMGFVRIIRFRSVDFENINSTFSIYVDLPWIKMSPLINNKKISLYT